VESRVRWLVVQPGYERPSNVIYLTTHVSDTNRPQMHAQEATIVHLEHRLKSALQLARQGRPLSGSPLPARVITPNGAGIGGEGPGASATRSDPETLRRIVELDSLVTAGTLERAQLRQACTDREIRCDELEESVAALQLELRHARASTVTLRSELARVQQQMGAPPTAMQPSQRNRQELEEKLGLQLDENEALRTTLKDTVRAKTEEITLLHDLLESTKRVFSDGLRSYKHRLIQSTPR
jgi:chromosome segregation ATPase